ncbi:MAG: DEAD/DEAH box helicase [Treponema sp.]|jgi:ATP-dependent Lhr-like helicase|nr:DEAD/DEAH box helicase [Treponema sp.]
MAYSRLAPFLREYIYSQKWTELRRIQEAAIHEVFDGTGHILIASGTASGKTEAAFLPLLSLLASGRAEGQAAPLVLCISPLKALINDQYERLKKITAGKVPLWRWHGDVAENHKKQFLADPGGVLIITPESMEALLLRQARNIRRIFAALAFVVIDEAHIFMGSERGSQLMCQLALIEQERSAGGLGGCARRLGLSATLGDYDGGQSWLSQGTGMPAVLLNEPGEKRRIRVAVDYFTGGAAEEAFYEALYEQCRNRRAIIFTNSRLEAEQCVRSLRRLAAALGENDIFHIHHGSIASPLRDEAEEKLRSGEGPSVIAATATLELGIDIGDLDRILQIGPPWSVSAFVQRLGRSGRKNGRPEMYFTVFDHAAVPGCSGLSSIPWDLLRTIAVIELYLNEKWIEPPEKKTLPYSLFAHELLGLLGSLGEHSPLSLCGRLFAMPPFARSSITKDDFDVILGHFRKCRYVEKTGEGLIILGTEGEKIVNRHSFYSVFPGEETFKVIFEGRELGTVNFVPPPGSVITVAGHAWLAESIDGGRREIRVREAGKTGEAGRLWGGGGGNVHRRIAEKVRQILAENGRYGYLGAAAENALLRGRRAAREAGILEKTAAAIPRKSGDTFTRLFIAPWLGGAGMRTVDAFLKKPDIQKKLALLSFEREGDFYFTVKTRHDEETFIKTLAEEAGALRESGGSLFPKTIPFTDKYDYLLPEKLLVKQYTANMLDTDGTLYIL